MPAEVAHALSWVCLQRHTLEPVAQLAVCCLLRCLLQGMLWARLARRVLVRAQALMLLPWQAWQGSAEPHCWALLHSWRWCRWKQRSPVDLQVYWLQM